MNTIREPSMTDPAHQSKLCDDELEGTMHLSGSLYRYFLRYPSERTNGKIWLEDAEKNELWFCEVLNITDCAPAGIVIPVETVFGYLRDCFESTIQVPEKPPLVKVTKRAEPGNPRDLTLESVFELGLLAGGRWKVIYKFAMKAVTLSTVVKLRTKVDLQEQQICELQTKIGELENALRRTKI